MSYKLDDSPPQEGENNPYCDISKVQLFNALLPNDLLNLLKQMPRFFEKNFVIFQSAAVRES